MTNLRPGQVHLDGASAHISYSGLVPPQHRGLLRELTEVFVPPTERRQGKATALMAEICRIADDENVTLLVQPAPFACAPGGAPLTDPGKGLSQRGLSVWYAGRFGFFTLQTEPALVMIRLPGEIQPTQAMPMSPIAQAARVVAQAAAARSQPVDNDRGCDESV